MRTALLLAALAGAAERSEVGPAADYRLGAGDVIAIAVFEVEELTQQAVIGADGTATLPLVGAVRMGGLTPAEAARRLEQLLRANLIRRPQVSVVVKEYRSQPVTVLGAVRSPGVYQLRGRRRLSEVLAMAGGLAPEAGAAVQVGRRASGGEQTFEVPTAGLLLRANHSAGDPWIEPYDTIRVMPAGVVYVVGEVSRPGGFPIRPQEPVTALKAVALAGGLTRLAAAQQARILRPGSPEITVRLKDVLQGRAPDPQLAPADVLFVPDSRARSALGRAAEAAVQAATGIVIWRR